MTDGHRGPQWVVVVEFASGQAKTFTADDAADVLSLALLRFEAELEVGNAVRMTLTYQ